jgi:DNA processing protein
VSGPRDSLHEFRGAPHRPEGGTTENAACRVALALSELRGIGRAALRAQLPLAAGQAIDSFALFATFVEEHVPDAGLLDFGEPSLLAVWDRAGLLMDECTSLGLQVLPFGWPSYPRQLCRLQDAPALLFVRGTLVPEQRPRIAVIGTRHASPWGIRTAKACADQVARIQGVVVSGLARGIDSAAHTGSLEAGGSTWAVLAHGLAVAPTSNIELAHRIVAEGGALISEYRPGEPPRRYHFIERDRIQAGLADAVLVVETGAQGGSMHTVHSATSAGIPVWTAFPDKDVGVAREDPGQLKETQRGTWKLVLDGARRVSTPRMLLKCIESLHDDRIVADAARSETPARQPRRGGGRTIE